MPGKLTFSIKGAKELESAFKALGPTVARKHADKSLREAAKPLVEEAKRLVPVRTGKLRRSITALTQRAQGGAFAATRTVLVGFKPPASRYAHLVEYGTTHSAPQPFMRPAMDSKKEEMLRALGNSLEEGIEREALMLARRGG